jgi:hypothetical protein
MPTNATYALTSSGSWTVPAGVSSITVECFGSTSTLAFSGSTIAQAQAKRDGASYSKSTTISVTAGQVFYHNIGASGGNTWFNTVNSAPVAGTDTSATSCLAVGGSTTSTSQVAANIGDTRYAGGAGNVSTGNTVSGGGGNAGPNGAGADSGVPYSNTGQSVGGGGPFLVGSGGGANGGSQGSLGVIPYGRTGSGATPGAGNGGYYTGSAYVVETTDATLSSGYIGNNPQTASTNYGATGGNVVQIVSGCCCIGQQYSYNGVNGRIIITLNSPTQKTFAIGTVTTNNTLAGSFTVPADFVSLVSIEAIGSGTLGNSSAATGGGGGGGGAYAYSPVSSITGVTITAGSTIVYYSVSGFNYGGDTWISIGTNSTPSSTIGVMAKTGSAPSTSTGGAGGSGASSVGTIKNSGGTGGAGSTGSRRNGGGGGGAGGFNSAGGTGGAAYNLSTADKGSGGGGSANSTSGSAGAGGLSAGGAGQSGLGTGGTGATASTSATAGTGGGGGGGGFGLSSPYYLGAVGGVISTSGTYTIGAGYGGSSGSSFTGGSGGGAPFSGAILFTYSTVAAPTATGNFFLMF